MKRLILAAAATLALLGACAPPPSEVETPATGATATPSKPARTATPRPVRTPTRTPTAPRTVAAVTPPAVSATLPACTWASVIRVVDGDTVVVGYEGREERLRYIGIDTPETVHPTRGVEPFGIEASARNKGLLAGGLVCLEKDITNRDRYGRLLRYAWLPDGTMVNEALLREGLATVVTYPPDVKYVQPRYLPAQQAAREAGRGVWGTGGR